MTSPRYDPNLTLPELTCEVCGNEPAVGVAAVPGVPYSAAYGRECLHANAHPYGILIANTAMIVWGYVDGDVDDPLANTADWWQQMVRDTLRHLDLSEEDFRREVAGVVDDLRREHEEHGEGH